MADGSEALEAPSIYDIPPADWGCGSFNAHDQKLTPCAATPEYAAFVRAYVGDPVVLKPVLLMLCRDHMRIGEGQLL